MKTSSVNYFFFDDYSEGAHPLVLEALSRTNLQQERGYGADSFTLEAATLIKEKIDSTDAQVHFVPTGTQANLICLSSLLKSYESVIAADSGHINVHEAGAIEATGHKVNVATSINGKLTSDSIELILSSHHDEHMVKPRVVYISQATELGTVYSKSELEDLYKTCKKNKLYLYIDGARIGNAVMSYHSDLDLKGIAGLCDLFYIGGTKNGALMGEAIVIVNEELQENFRYHLRQHGALLAKARAVSVQFGELFKNNLYFENAAHANKMAQKLASGIKKCGYEFLTEPVANQLFPVLPNTTIKILEKKFGFYVWSKAKLHHSVIRLVTSWATKEAAVDEFLVELHKIHF